MDPQLIPFGWGLFKDDQEVKQVKYLICQQSPWHSGFSRLIQDLKWWVMTHTVQYHLQRWSQLRGRQDQQGCLLPPAPSSWTTPCLLCPPPCLPCPPLRPPSWRSPLPWSPSWIPPWSPTGSLWYQWAPLKRPLDLWWDRLPWGALRQGMLLGWVNKPITKKIRISTTDLGLQEIC